MTLHPKFRMAFCLISQRPPGVTGLPPTPAPAAPASPGPGRCRRWRVLNYRNFYTFTNTLAIAGGTLRPLPRPLVQGRLSVVPAYVMHPLGGGEANGIQFWWAFFPFSWW